MRIGSVELAGTISPVLALMAARADVFRSRSSVVSRRSARCGARRPGFRIFGSGQPPAQPGTVSRVDQLAIPERLRHEYREWRWSVAWQYAGTVTTWKLVHPGSQIRYLKLKSAEGAPRLVDEAEKMRWAGRHLPVPTVVAAGTEDGVDFLVTHALAGRPAIADDLKADPPGLVRSLASALRFFHTAPVEDCPFRMSPAQAVELVKARVLAGEVVPSRDFHTEHAELGLDQAVSRMEELSGFNEDLVVCHGDFCLPNVLFNNGHIAGYLDLGELVVADRWWDLAIGSWSVTWNLGPGLEELFYSSYGAEADQQKIGFFRLLYDLIG